MLGPIMCDLKGFTLTQDETNLLQHPHIGGVILFARNYQDLSQLKALTDSIRALRPDILLAVDHEGGRVQRFLKGFTRLPNMQSLGEFYEREAAGALHLTEQLGFVMATELAVFDFDISFAPVLDLNYRHSRVIGNRSFHRDPKQVIPLARSLMTGMKIGGLACVGKHFPGHGYVVPDSHLTLPVDEREFSEIEADDLMPFKMLANDLDAIMPAHVFYPNVDDRAATFSRHWLQTVLREKLGFKGAIISDCLNMKGAHVMGDDLFTRVQAATQAGCDMVLACNDQASVFKLLEQLEAMPIRAESAERLAPLRRPHHLAERTLKASALWREASQAVHAWSTALDEPSHIDVNDPVAVSGVV